MNPFDGFDEFVRARTGPLSRTAYLLTGDHHLAQDLLQIALARMASRWPQLRDGFPDAYARQVMVNEFTSWRRRRHLTPSQTLSWDLFQPVTGQLTTVTDLRAVHLE